MPKAPGDCVVVGVTSVVRRCSGATIVVRTARSRGVKGSFEPRCGTGQTRTKGRITMKNTDIDVTQASAGHATRSDASAPSSAYACSPPS